MTTTQVRRNENVSVAKLLSNHLLRCQELSLQRERSGRWSPSSLGGCFRKQVWNRANEAPTNPPDLKALKRFETGNIIEAFIVKCLSDIDAEFQVEVNNEYIKGYADVVFPDEVVEIKSTTDYVFKYMNEKDFNVEREKPHNVFQVMAYAHFLNKPFARLVYVGIPSLVIAEFKLVCNDWWKNKVDTELKTLEQYKKEGRLPAAEQRLGEWECKYCQFKDKCDSHEAKAKENENG